MPSTVRMPEVLANATEAIIQTWLVERGQSVAVGTPLAEVETDKAVVEYAAEIAGTLLDLLVGEGETVAVGAPIAVIGDPGETAADETAADETAQPEPAPDDVEQGREENVTAPDVVEQRQAPEPETAPDVVDQGQAPEPELSLYTHLTLPTKRIV